MPAAILHRSVSPATDNNLTRVRLRSPGRASEGGDGRARAVGNGPANAGSLGDQSYGDTAFPRPSGGGGSGDGGPAGDGSGADRLLDGPGEAVAGALGG